MIKLKDIINEAIPKLPRINMGKSQKIIKDMEEIVKQLKRVLGK